MAFNLGKLIYSVFIDDADAKKQLKEMESKLNTFAGSAKKTGSSLSKNLTLPITALGVASLKLASDFEVASRKFAGAFKGAEVKAAASVENLSESFGLANSQATELLAFTGDILKGFGATSDQALQLATSTQEVAAALAAYNGVPVKQASEAITKALTGERDSLKSLGVVVSEEAVKRQLLADGTADLTGEELLLAKANATLTITMSQSKDAIASFADNTDTAAFMTSKLIGDAKDLGVQLGTILLPILKDLITQVSGAVEWFSDLDVETQKLILGIGAVVAVAGPAISAIGGISAALAFLAANPIVLAIAGVTALTVGLAALDKKMSTQRTLQLSEDYRTLAEDMGVVEEGSKEVTQELKDFAVAADLVTGALKRGDYYATFESVSKQVEELAKNTGLTEREIISISKSVGGLSEDYRSYLDLVEDNLDALDKEKNKLGLIAGQKEYIAELSAAELAKIKEKEESEKEASDKALEAAKKLREELEAQQIADRLSALAAYNNEIEQTQIKAKLGLLDNREVLEENLSAAENYAQALIDAGYDGADAATYGDRALITMSATIKSINEQLETMDELENNAFDKEEKTNARIALEQEWYKKHAEIYDDRAYLIEQEEKEAIAAAEKVGASTVAIEEYYDKKKTALVKTMAKEREDAAAAEIAAEQKYWKDLVDDIQGYYNAIKTFVDIASGFGSVANSIYDSQIEGINNKLEADLYAIDTATQKELADADLLEETTAERYARELQELKDKLAEETDVDKKAALEASIIEKQKAVDRQKILDKAAEDKAALEKEAAEETYKLELEQFNLQQGFRVAETIMTGAQAAISAFNALAGIPGVGPALGTAAAIAVGVLTAAQVAAIQKEQPPQPPKLAEGGIANSPGGGINAIVGEAGPEAILPLNDKTFAALGEAINQSQQASTSNTKGNDLNIMIEGFGKITIEDVIQNGLNNNNILVPASAVVQGGF